ncbi:MAG: GGDEF domain-containing protein [Ruminococcus sp.]|nr:GGDEF domain-containing protein [Ruminococcus sp.]
MKRKTIGVCVTGYDWEYETRIVDGIYHKCQENGINVLVFASLMRKPELNHGEVLPNTIIRGETEIFHLINYDLLDGLILIGNSFLDPSIIPKIAKMARLHNVPIVNVNDTNHEVELNIHLSDKTAMESIMQHLVEEHGFTKIDFIGGFPGNLQTEERLKAYKKVLTEHHIPVKESRIGYGRFWKEAADCTETFLKTDGIPDAIVCASDTMAIFCMDYLKEHGYCIPEDVVVTGFDGIQDGLRYTPTLTTIRHAFSESGKTVELIESVWNGETPLHITYINSVLEKRQSCGCIPINDEESNNYCEDTYSTQHIFLGFNNYIFQMNTKFASARNSEELYLDTRRGAEIFHFKKFYVCICSNLEKNSGKIDKDNIRGSYTGIALQMVSMVQYGHNVKIGTIFPTEQLLPVDFLHGEKPVFYGFFPLYFQNQFLGYLAYEPTKTHGIGDFFATWVMSISNNAGSFYMKHELENIVDELENLYMQDPLTRLYNRRSMLWFGYNLADRAQQNGDWITVVCADLDGLKPINDKYGHESGDNAIKQAASAIRSAMPENSICIRTGGDEYCIILSHKEEHDIDGYIAKIDTLLQNYNRESGLPYQINCSYGFYSVSSENLTSIDAMMKKADERMYQVKIRKHTNW